MPVSACFAYASWVLRVDNSPDNLGSLVWTFYSIAIVVVPIWDAFIRPVAVDLQYPISRMLYCSS